MKPLILINCKTYEEVSGEKGILFARKIAGVRSAKYEVAIAPSLLLLREVCRIGKIGVFAQQVEGVGYGAHTGAIVAGEVKKAGARGVILNHSERKLEFGVLKASVERCRREGLEVVICASSVAEVKKVAVLEPEYVAYEPAALIGGDVSVTSAKPGVISDVVRIVRVISPKTKVLCGAGVHDREDLQTAIRLGACGVLLAHAIVCAKDPAGMLKKMMR